ncbi:MAG TPA: ATP synthase F1 subunit epsilon [Flavobacteriales bacterium]|jgi:F-type H+-transporting ATPase subunit epsilon|nr:ATP synthase F1 subunit epsilon [Flavobacteriales bacterium]HIO72043.1 ATP synthase F1 subunit epsilon [Flavobacteriales bacterium]
MRLEIVTPDKQVFSGEIISAKFPGAEGSFGVLKDHAPIISTLKEGVIEVVEENKKERSFEIGGGVVEVLKNRIIVLAE